MSLRSSIAIQCCGMIILLIIILLHYKRPRLNMFTEQIFIGSVWFSICCLLFDIASAVLMLCNLGYDNLFLLMSTKLYLMSLACLSCIYLFYLVVKCNGLKQICTHIISMNSVLLVVESIFIVFLPVLFVTHDTSWEKHGLAISVTYLSVAIFVIEMLIVFARYTKQIATRQKIVMVVLIFTIVIVAIIQHVVPSLMIVSFASTLCCLIIFIEFENPESKLDRETGLFIIHELVPYIRYLRFKNVSYEIISVTINYKRHDMENNERIEMYNKITDVLMKRPHTHAFKDVDDSVIIVLTHGESKDKFMDEFTKLVFDTSDMCRPPSYLLVGDIQYRARDIMNAIHRFKLSPEYDRQSVQLLTQPVYNKHVKFDETKRMIIDAITQGNIEIFIQPIYSVSDGKFTSGEVLARIRDANNEILPPADFIDVAEQSGLITQIETIVFEKTCKLLKNEMLQIKGVSHLNINLSVIKCEDIDLFEEYSDIMKKHSITPDMINLEITETAVISKKSHLMRNISLFLEQGVKLSLDDFGSGESNLNYITSMPVNMIKFDKDMTAAYFANEKANVVIKSTVDMAHKLGLDVVYEGVETKEQYDTLSTDGRDYIQGYYFSKPLCESDFIKYIVEHN